MDFKTPREAYLEQRVRELEGQVRQLAGPQRATPLVFEHIELEAVTVGAHMARFDRVVSWDVTNDGPRRSLFVGKTHGDAENFTMSIYADDAPEWAPTNRLNLLGDLHRRVIDVLADQIRKIRAA